ncbi:MAG: DUF4340 domain-containing protein [Clostridia bacterium]|nr:DUF4340 domain-containing protein [Clostridia bacterium]
MREVKPTIFRRIRSLSPLMKSALIIGLCTLLTLGGFLVYTLTEESRRNTEKTVMETMIPQIKRDNCLSVAMHPKNGSPYEIRRMAFKDAAGNPTYSFMLYQNDKVYTDLTLDAARLSELLVSSGTAYIRETVAEVPPLPVQEAYADPADYAEARAEYEKSLAVYLKKCADHGLREEDSPAYYRITDLAENTYTVYVGNVSPTGGGYYMRVEGKEAVYVSQTAQMGDFLKGSSADFVSCQLFYPANNTYAYAYPRSFSALETERLADPGTAVTSADTVRITCTGGTSGDTPVSFTVNLGEAGTEEALRTLLVGKTPGTYREPFVLGEKPTPFFPLIISKTPLCGSLCNTCRRVPERICIPIRCTPFSGRKTSPPTPPIPLPPSRFLKTFWECPAKWCKSG